MKKPMLENEGGRRISAYWPSRNMSSAVKLHGRHNGTELRVVGIFFPLLPF